MDQTDIEITELLTLTQEMEACNDELLSLAINLAFAGSLRMRELLALTCLGLRGYHPGRN